MKGLTSQTENLTSLKRGERSSLIRIWNYGVAVSAAMRSILTPTATARGCRMLGLELEPLICETFMP